MLKMYVWEGVLTDWTSGLVACMATSVEEARSLACASLGREDREIMTEEPEIYDSPSCVYVYGGG